jgi:hypothetical protein
MTNSNFMASPRRVGARRGLAICLSECQVPGPARRRKVSRRTPATRSRGWSVCQRERGNDLPESGDAVDDLGYANDRGGEDDNRPGDRQEHPTGAARRLRRCRTREDKAGARVICEGRWPADTNFDVIGHHCTVRPVIP